MAYDNANTYENIELIGLTERDAHLPIPEDHILGSDAGGITWWNVVASLRQYEIKGFSRLIGV